MRARLARRKMVADSLDLKERANGSTFLRIQLVVGYRTGLGMGKLRNRHTLPSRFGLLFPFVLVVDALMAAAPGEAADARAIGGGRLLRASPAPGADLLRVRVS
jgi:hypothetical protein